MQISLPARPDGKSTKAYDIQNDDWHKVYERSRDFIDYIVVLNTSGQIIYLADEQNPEGDNFDQIAPGEALTEERDPKELWVKRHTNATNPRVRVTSVFFTPEQIERLKKMKLKFEG